MKIPSKKQIDKNEELIQLLNHTEREWEAFKQRKPRNNRRCSAASFLEHSLDHLLEHSPRELMYSLQRGGFGERNLDSAVEEVFEERRDGIRSGRIRGRRLFAEAVELDLDYEDHGAGAGGVGGDVLGKSVERDLADMVSVSCLSEESLSEEKEVVVEKKVAEEKGCIGGGCGGGGGGGCGAAMPWLVFLLILVIIGLISVSCYRKYVSENELFLVPT